jgi:hypothetical protein
VLGGRQSLQKALENRDAAYQKAAKMPAKRLQRAEGGPSEAAVLERHFFSDALPQVGGFPIGTVQTVANKSARTNMFILCAWYFFQQFEQNPALAERFDHVCHV